MPLETGSNGFDRRSSGTVIHTKVASANVYIDRRGTGRRPSQCSTARARQERAHLLRVGANQRSSSPPEPPI